MSKLLDEIRNLSPEERKQLADELKALDENAVPVTLIWAGGVCCLLCLSFCRCLSLPVV